MDTDQNSKFPLHEAARDGKRMIFDLNVLNLMLTFRSSNGRVALECQFRPAYSGMLSRYILYAEAYLWSSIGQSKTRGNQR